jgi:hypothetical protein
LFLPTVPTASTRPTEAPWTPPPPTESPANLIVAGESFERCSIRVTAKGILVDDDLTTRAQAIVLCKQRRAAVVELADDANQVEWRQLHSALVAANAQIMLRGVRGDARECSNNPLAKGCM